MQHTCGECASSYTSTWLHRTLLPQHASDTSDQAQSLHSIFVDNDVQEPETSVTPDFLYYCREILTGLCLGDGCVLLDGMQYIFPLFDLYFEIFRRHLATKK